MAEDQDKQTKASTSSTASRSKTTARKPKGTGRQTSSRSASTPKKTTAKSASAVRSKAPSKKTSSGKTTRAKSSTAKPKTSQPKTSQAKTSQAKSAQTKASSAKTDAKAQTPPPPPPPSRNADKEGWTAALWQAAGVLFFTGLSMIGLAVLASFAIAHVILTLAQVEHSILRKWQDVLLQWMGEALDYITHPKSDLPFPFRPISSANPKS